VELRVAVALAHTGRGDAYLLFARRTPSGAGKHADLTAAEADYRAGVDILADLHEKKLIGGTDLKTLESARAELARIRQDLAGRPITREQETR
jgi:hypothetical protein